MSVSYFAYKFLGAAVTPPGLFFVLILLLFLALFRRPGQRRIASLGLCVTLAATLLSTPAVSGLLLSPLESTERSLPEVASKSIVIVLAGGVNVDTAARVPYMETETLARFLEGLLLAGEHGWPLLYSGGYPEKANEEDIRRMVLAAADRLGGRAAVSVEGASRTTWENLSFVAPTIQKTGVTDVVLVTSAYHMPRSLYCASRLLPGVRIHPWPALRKSEPAALSALDWVPSPGGLYNTSVALREYVGLAAYRLFLH